EGASVTLFASPEGGTPINFTSFSTEADGYAEIKFTSEIGQTDYYYTVKPNREGWEEVKGSFDFGTADSDTINVILTNPNVDPNEGWTSLGNATFQDGWLLPCFGIDQTDSANWYEVELQQNDATPTTYRLVDPYKGNAPLAEINEATGHGYIEFSVADPDHVTFSLTDAGFASERNGFSKFYCYNSLSLYTFYYPNLSTEQIVSALGDQIPYSTYKDGVVTISSTIVDGKYSNDASFGDQDDPTGGYGWTGSDKNPANMEARIIFPGTVYPPVVTPEPRNFTASFYVTDQNANPIEGASVTLFASPEGGTPINFTSFSTEADGYAEIKFTSEIGQTDYYYTVKPNREGWEEVKGSFDFGTADSDTINVILTNPNVDPNEGWTSLGNATFQDGWLLPCFGIDQTDSANWYEVELQQNDATPTTYRLVDPYKGNAPVAEINEAIGHGYIEFSVADPDHVTFSTVNAGFAYAEAAISEMYCRNKLSYYIVNNPTLTSEQIINALGNNIPYTTYKDGVVTIGSTLTDGNYVNDACFGIQDAVNSGYSWTDSDKKTLNMEARIIFPGTVYPPVV
ncbi:MAG: hypothetical protein K2M97_03985, partial [Muribaculaceae bacterium]|nr:hypothetical protein [Muribaculaceae bacterium]